LKRALAVTNALQGRPSDATLSLPHNDSWLFEDNVDATHPANLRYVIAGNVTRVVSARLSIHLAPYRTYSSFTVTATGGQSVTHNHGHTTTHTHTETSAGASPTHFVGTNANAFTAGDSIGGAGVAGTLGITDASAPGSTDNASNDHTHPVSGTSFLGVSEGASPTGVTIAFDGVDATAALGGPFSADVIELDVRRFLAIAKGAWHTIAMQPTGLGRIEAHLRLGVYVAAAQVN
jgi:hypothetical protein